MPPTCHLKRPGVRAGEADFLRPLVEPAQPALRFAAADRADVRRDAAEIRRRAAVGVAAAVARRMLPRGDRGQRRAAEIVLGLQRDAVVLVRLRVVLRFVVGTTPRSNEAGTALVPTLIEPR